MSEMQPIRETITTKVKRKIKEEISSYRCLIFGYIFMIIVNTLVTFIVLNYPELSYILVISPETPWGIVTAHFTHTNIETLESNMTGLTWFLLLFALSSSYHSPYERIFRTYFFLVVILFMPILSAFLNIILLPDLHSVGSSGIVYASNGAVMAFILLNVLEFSLSLLVMELQKKPISVRNPGTFIILSSAIIFSIYMIQLILEPGLFLNISPGVNVFMHGVPFMLSFASILVYLLFRKHGTRLLTEESANLIQQ